jgi:hypothetical protein
MNAYNVLLVWGASTPWKTPDKSDTQRLDHSVLDHVYFTSNLKTDQVCPSVRYACMHGCENGTHCVKNVAKKKLKSKHGDQLLDILADPFATAFTGNVNRFPIQTTASNSFRTFYPNSKRDPRRGDIDMYTGFDVDVLKAFAQNMNFTYRWRRPEPIATWGSQLRNGSWNGIVGESKKKIKIKK